MFSNTSANGGMPDVITRAGELSVYQQTIVESTHNIVFVAWTQRRVEDCIFHRAKILLITLDLCTLCTAIYVLFYRCNDGTTPQF